MKINSDRLKTDFDALAQIGALPNGGVNRLALSLEDLQARQWFAERIEEAGLQLHDDDAGNVSAVLRSEAADAKTLLIGSHLDSVPNGGRFDGAVGVVSALECLRTLRERNIALPFHLEAIDFTDDEGCWRSLLGSRAVAGLVTPADLHMHDDGMFRAALSRAGIELRRIPLARRAPETLAGYLELHIESGPRIERAGVDIGIVTNIVGRKTYEITYHGKAGHSGTTDMYQRRDALRGAALFIVRAHDVMRERYGDGIFNAGNLVVEPGAFNIIPNRAVVTAECRHFRTTLMNEMETVVFSLARECAASYGLEVSIATTAQMPAAAMSVNVSHAILQACEQLQLSFMHLISYAGHDAQILAQVVPTGMIFIPSMGGIGHEPREFTRWDDVVNGANVLLHSILNLAAT